MGGPGSVKETDAMLEALKQEVYEANMELPRRGLVTYTWGNVSGIDREKGLFVIKPSGVSYEDLKPEDLVVLDLEGRQVEGKLNPSSDTKTHVVLYNAFPEIGGIVHTHSPYAVAWSQAGRDIPAYGTTHADYFYGPIPCARNLTQEEIEADYETNTGHVVVETFRLRGINPIHVPAVICRNHGPFTWGRDAAQAVYHSVVLEEVAKMAMLTETVNPEAPPAPQSIQDKHFLRKHGPNAYYGQPAK
jgi:L-ribulose-5-phosphate 4-epimerase